MIVYSSETRDQCSTRGELFRLRGSVVPYALLFALPSGILAILLVNAYTEMDGGEDIKEDIAANQVKASQLWSALAATLTFLVGFRTNKAYQRFWDGTTLLNQMFGEWFDASSCLFAFSHLPRITKAKEVSMFRQTLIRLFSLMHGSALDEISGTDEDPEGYPCLDVGGLDYESLRVLDQTNCVNDGADEELKFNRVEVLIHMIQVLIVQNQDNGVLKIPPPILSRVFQTISRGQVNLANCRKIKVTLFPYPYAQLIKLLQIVLSTLTPVVMASILQNEHWAFIFTIMPLFGFEALNRTAQELEMPFGSDPNDLPLMEFHEHMNEALMMLIRQESDLVPAVSDVAETELDKIRSKISTQRPGDFLQAAKKAADKMEAAKMQVIEVKEQTKAESAPAIPPSAIPDTAAAPVPAAAPAPMQASLLGAVQ